MAARSRRSASAASATVARVGGRAMSPVAPPGCRIADSLYRDVEYRSQLISHREVPPAEMKDSTSDRAIILFRPWVKDFRRFFLSSSQTKLGLQPNSHAVSGTVTAAGMAGVRLRPALRASCASWQDGAEAVQQSTGFCSDRDSVERSRKVGSSRIESPPSVKDPSATHGSLVSLSMNTHRATYRRDGPRTTGSQEISLGAESPPRVPPTDAQELMAGLR
jgi:hypothetical protein